MWPNNRIINKALNKLIKVFLKMHFAPNRTSEYQGFIESKLNQESCSNVKTSRNSFYNAIRSENTQIKFIFEEI